MPRSRFGIFCNERTRSTPLDPKLTFWCVHTIWVHSGPFDCLMKLGAQQAEVVRKFVPRSRIGIFCNKRTRSTPLDPILTFWRVSYYFVHLGLFGCLTKLGAKRAELMQKFLPRSCVGIFHNERTRSTPLDPTLLFCCILYHLGPFLVALQNWCKTSRTSAKVHATKSRRNFSQRKHPIHHIGP